MLSNRCRLASLLVLVAALLAPAVASGALARHGGAKRHHRRHHHGVHRYAARCAPRHAHHRKGHRHHRTRCASSGVSPFAQSRSTQSKGPSKEPEHHGKGAVSAPANTALPTISGSSIRGQTLSATTGSWSGSAPIGYAYQWRRAGAQISGASEAKYTLTAADVGSKIDVAVTASNARGSSTAVSAATAPVSAPAEGGGSPPPPPPPPPPAAPAVSGVSPGSGPETGGTLVTVTGSGFGGVTAVRFGAAQASSYSVSSTSSLTAVAPPGNGAQDVTVTASGGISATSSADRFEYTQSLEGLPAETWQAFSATNPMPAGMTPGSASSPFNVPVGAPAVLSNSSEMVSWLLSSISPGVTPIKTISRPGGGALPMVYASNSDPVVQLVASGSGDVNGRRIRIPAQTEVGETVDKHITIVLAPIDAKTPGETVDLWLAESESSGRLKIVGGQLHYVNGGSGSLTGSLLAEHTSSVSAGWSAIAGQIRGPELKAGVIPHALAAVVKNTKAGPPVYPASGSDGSSTDPAAPATGQRFYLAYTDAEIEALKFKPWKTAVLTALAHYGFYIEDTGNENTSFRWEGSRMYVPFGAPEPFEAIGREQGLPQSGGKYQFNLYEGVDWTRLRAIAPPP